MLSLKRVLKIHRSPSKSFQDISTKTSKVVTSYWAGYSSQKSNHNSSFLTHLYMWLRKYRCCTLTFKQQIQVYHQTDNLSATVTQRLLVLEPFVHIRVFRSGLWEANGTLFLWPHAVSSTVWQCGSRLQPGESGVCDWSPVHSVR